MSEYLLCIIGTVLVSAVLVAVMPDGKMSTLIKGATKLACLIAIVAPVQTLLKGVQSDEKNENSQDYFVNAVIEMDASFIQYYSEMRVADAARALKEEILRQFSCQTQVTLDWVYDTSKNAVDKIKLVCVLISLPDDIPPTLQEQIVAYVTANYCKEVLLV